jgi:hypothetical protein
MRTHFRQRKRDSKGGYGFRESVEEVRQAGVGWAWRGCREGREGDSGRGDPWHNRGTAGPGVLCFQGLRDTHGIEGPPRVLREFLSCPFSSRYAPGSLRYETHRLKKGRITGQRAFGAARSVAIFPVSFPSHLGYCGSQNGEKGCQNRARPNGDGCLGATLPGERADHPG